MELKMGKLYIGLLKCIVFCYDILTLPIYFIFQKPWEKWRSRKQIWGKQINKNDPYSPYVTNYDMKQNRPLNVGNTLDQLFRKAVESNADKKAFGTREIYDIEEIKQKDGKIFKKYILGDYKWTTLKEADVKVTNIAKGLRNIGVNPRDKVVILAETRFEWFLIAEACFRTNIIVATSYTNLGEDGMIFGINDADTQYLITSSELLQKIKKIVKRLPNIKNIIYMEDFTPPNLNGFPEDVQLIPFSQLESSGQNLNIELEAPKPDDTALLVYTSGSTAAPKGVIVSHKSLLTCVEGFHYSNHDIFEDGEVFVAYLPLAHMYEILAEHFSICHNVAIAYSSPYTITDKSTGIKSGCKGDLSLIKPTLLAAVPMMLDRIRKSVNEMVESKGEAFKNFFKFALEYKQFWIKAGFDTPILNKLVFNHISGLVGGRLRYMSCGSAPLSADTHHFTEICLGVKIVQGYGLTETCGAGTLSRLEDDTVGRVGPPLPLTQVRLIDWEEGGYHPTDKPYPRGEAVIGGDSVTSGYYKNEELTKESYKEENGMRWFYTGDIIEAHPDGCFKIIDRKKDLLKLQYGEYVSLGKIESELKTSPLVDNICVCGSGYLDYVVALVVPNISQLKSLAKQFNKENLSITELCFDDEITKEATKRIQKHAVECRLLRTEIPKYVKLCPEEWLPETGLVTAAFKIKRKVIEQYYRSVLNEMMENNVNSKST